jgi:hypothetical protein
VLIEMVTAFRFARGFKSAFGLAAAVLQSIGRCVLQVQRPLGCLARLAKTDDVTHPVPLVWCRVLMVGRVRLEPVLLRQIRPYQGNGLQLVLSREDNFKQSVSECSRCGRFFTTHLVEFPAIGYLNLDRDDRQQIEIFDSKHQPQDDHQ